MKLADACILVVDDEQALTEIFSSWLERAGAKVLTAANGVEALKLLQENKVDAMVSDLRMPVMGGVELVRRMCELKLATVPSIIFVSGFGEIELREMYGLGVEALLEKPLSRKDMIRALENSLMEREGMWLEPTNEPIAQRVALQMESLAAARACRRFQLGRGGCCFSADQPLLEEKTIDLSIQFADEGLELKAQGRVRWSDTATGQAGISFDYLDTGCRGWIVGAMVGRGGFIPDGRAAPG